MNWKALQQLHQIYTEGTASGDILKYPYIKRQLEMERIREEGKSLVKTDLFDEFYERKHLKKFERIQKLLIQHDFVSSNFKEYELERLLIIEQEIDIILDCTYSLKEVSSHYFDNSKYFKKGSKLHKIILKILDVETLHQSYHDQQFLYVLHCQSKTPKAIMLCENDNLLRKPRLTAMELWYAGGANTAKLAYVPTPQIPMYYLCDWDNKGMEIYQRIKRDYFSEIQLIVPKTPKFLPAKSEWKTDIDESFFTEDALQLLVHLKENNLWIEEEGIDISTLA